MKGLRLIALLAALSLLSLTACGEDPLENQNQSTGDSDGDADDGDADNGDGDADDGDADDGDGDGTGEEWGDYNPEFAQIGQQIVQVTCAVGGCHGTPSTSSSNLEFGANTTDLTPAMLQGVFESYISPDGTPLVDPGNAQNSDLYLRAIHEDQNLRMPPAPLSALSEAQLQLVQSWINGGAPYR